MVTVVTGLKNVGNIRVFSVTKRMVTVGYIQSKSVTRVTKRELHGDTMRKTGGQTDGRTG